MRYDANGQPYTFDKQLTMSFEIKMRAPSEAPEDSTKNQTWNTPALNLLFKSHGSSSTVGQDKFEIGTGVEVLLNKCALTPVVYKTIDGSTTGLVKDEFTFDLKNANGKQISTATNAADGTITFPELEFTRADVGKNLVYKISEETGTGTAFHYDTRELTMTVTVTEDEQTHELSAVAVYTDPDGKVLPKPTFNNIAPHTGVFTPAGTKTLHGRSQAAGEFSFTVRDASGTVVSTGKNQADGNIEFTSVNYTEADIGKSYTYTISEDAGTLSGVSYDPASYTVTVSITDGTDKLNVAAVYSNGKDGVEFVNSYTATGSFTPVVTKVLNGRQMTDGEFAFTMKDEQGETVATGTSKADGSVAFTPVAYTQEDIGKTFKYIITENEGSEQDIRYDASVYTLEVKVEDTGDGKLSVSASYMKDGQKADKIVFTNTYTPPAYTPPSSNNPPSKDLKTGDDSQVGMWAMLGILAAAVVIAMAWIQRRHGKRMPS